MSNLNNFCKFLLAYSYNNYENLSNHQLGCFKKGKHKASHDQLRLASDCDLNVVNFCTFFYNVFESTKPTSNYSEYAELYSFLKNDANYKYKYGKISEFTDDQKASFKLYTDAATDIFNTSTDEPAQQLADNILTDNTQEQLDSFINDPLTINQSVKELCNQLSSRFARGVDDTMIVTENVLADMISKHLGKRNNYTSTEISELQNKLSFTYNKFLREKNHLSNLQSHKDNKTTPEPLNHNKFPKPNPARAHCPVYVNGINKMIEEMQTQFIDYEMKACERSLSVIKSDLKIYEDLLKQHVHQGDLLVQELFALQEDLLKPELNRLSMKVSKSTKKPYTIVPLHKQPAKVPPKQPTKAPSAKPPAKQDTKKPHVAPQKQKQPTEPPKRPTRTNNSEKPVYAKPQQKQVSSFNYHMQNPVNFGFPGFPNHQSTMLNNSYNYPNQVFQQPWINHTNR